MALAKISLHCFLKQKEQSFTVILLNGVDDVGSVGAWLVWVHQILTWVKQIVWMEWMAEFHKISRWVKQLAWVKDNVNILVVQFLFII